MKNIPLPLLHLIVLPLAAVAQQTKDLPPPAAKVELHSLQTIVTDTVHRRQPTAVTEASVHDTAFARIRDAEFASDGRLSAFVVDAPPDAKAPAGPPRLLPASAVRWDPATRRWLLASPTQTFEELAAHELPADDEKPKQPASKVVRTSRLASELLRSETAEAPADGAVKVLDASQKRQPSRVVWWFAPTAQQLAVAVVPAGGKHVVVPWSALRFDDNPTSPKVRVEPAASLVGAPTCEHGDAVPDEALRRRSYEHFGATPPTWDHPSADAPRKTNEPDKGKEVEHG